MSTLIGQNPFQGNENEQVQEVKNSSVFFACHEILGLESELLHADGKQPGLR